MIVPTIQNLHALSELQKWDKRERESDREKQRIKTD